MSALGIGFLCFFLLIISQLKFCINDLKTLNLSPLQHDSQSKWNTKKSGRSACLGFQDASESLIMLPTFCTHSYGASLQCERATEEALKMPHRNQGKMLVTYTKSILKAIRKSICKATIFLTNLYYSVFFNKLCKVGDFRFQKLILISKVFFSDKFKRKRRLSSLAWTQIFLEPPCHSSFLYNCL